MIHKYVLRPFSSNTNTTTRERKITNNDKKNQAVTHDCVCAGTHTSYRARPHTSQLQGNEYDTQEYRMVNEKELCENIQKETEKEKEKKSCSNYCTMNAKPLSMRRSGGCVRQKERRIDRQSEETNQKGVKPPIRNGMKRNETIRNGMK